MLTSAEEGRGGRRALLATILTLTLVAALWALGPLSRSTAQAGLQPSDGGGAPAVGAAAVVSGELAIYKFSFAGFFGVTPGDPVSYSVSYVWTGDGPAPGVQVVDQLPPEVAFVAADPAPTVRQGRTLTWSLGTVPTYTWGTIWITVTVFPTVPVGTIFTNTATITASVRDSTPANNQDQEGIEVVPALPDLWLWKIGLFEELGQGFLFQAEQGVEAAFHIFYMNVSRYAAPNTVLVDRLPPGTTFVSADPAPSQVQGGWITWTLGTVPPFGFGEVKIYAIPNLTGSLTNTAILTTPVGDKDPTDNESSFRFEVIPVFPPRLLKPNGVDGTTYDEPLRVGRTFRLEGLARAGGQVVLYEGSKNGCWGDFSLCTPTPVVTVPVGSDRRWTMGPITLTQGVTKAYYLRAEWNGRYSPAPNFLGFWTPFFVVADPLLDGWDLDNFVVETGGQTYYPGGLGGTTGTTPNAPFTLRIRQWIRSDVPTTPSLRDLHTLRLVIDDGSGVTRTETLPVTEFRPVTTPLASGVSPAALRLEYDLIYVHYGLGPGARVEIWCLPIYYDDANPDLPPLVGLVWVKCNEILIDPAGYVYDLNTTGTSYDWPAIPPSDALVTNATVTVTVRSGDNSWTLWNAATSGQVNPQVTDLTTPDGIRVPGYFAFYVPPGQYRVLASAPDCTSYVSPILTVVDAPVFHNVALRCGTNAQVGVNVKVYLPSIQR